MNHCCYKHREVRLWSSDFANGTYTIDSPGIYVLQEDVAFDPVSSHALSTNAHSNPFAAVRITSPNVVLDLNQKRLGQSLSYYSRMRVFNIIQLNISPFVNGQGPAVFNREQGLDGGRKKTAAASCCVIRNGTLALSSHNCIHGNNNADIHIHDLTCSHFDVGGIQLNACRNVTIERVHAHPSVWCPFSSYSLMSGLHTDTEPHLAEAWTFILESAKNTTVLCLTEAQKRLWDDMRRMEDSIPCLRVIRSRIGRADGSAMYGILVNCEGHATGRLEDGEEVVANSRSCAVARALMRPADVKQRNGKARSSVVSIFDVVISSMHLDSLEIPCIVDDNGDAVTHMSGASVPYPCNDEFSEWYDHLGMVVETPTARRSAALCNMDVMRHVCKGVFGIRLHCVDCVHIHGVTITDLNNYSKRVCIPSDVEIIQPDSRDVGMKHKFCGCDLYGIFIGFCMDVVLENTRLTHFHVHEPHGIIRAIEIMSSMNVQTNSVIFSEMKGIQTTMLHVQDDNKCVYLEDMSYTTREEDKQFAKEKIRDLCHSLFRSNHIGERLINMAMMEWVLYNMMDDPCMIKSEKERVEETCL